jgi:hypothetical protein
MFYDKILSTIQVGIKQDQSNDQNKSTFMFLDNSVHFKFL